MHVVWLKCFHSEIILYYVSGGFVSDFNKLECLESLSSGQWQKIGLGDRATVTLETVLCVVMDGCKEKEAGPLRDLHMTLLGKVQGSVQSGRGQDGTGR